MIIIGAKREDNNQILSYAPGISELFFMGFFLVDGMLRLMPMPMPTLMTISISYTFDRTNKLNRINI